MHWSELRFVLVLYTSSLYYCIFYLATLSYTPSIASLVMEDSLMSLRGPGTDRKRFAFKVISIDVVF
jgi:hypothetical protein